MMEETYKILLVEDNPADCKWIDIQLQKAFGDALIFETCGYLSKALELLEKNTYSIVILDLTIPDSTGLEGLKKILELDYNCPIIILTGLDDESLGVEAVQLGAQDYLIKGKTSSNGLKRSITYSMERSKLSKQLVENIKKVEESEVRQEFFATLSHEIRTPLNGIIGFTNLLLKDELTPTQREQLEAVKHSGDILLVLINDILDFFKIETDNIKIESTELKLDELVNSTLGSFQLMFQEKELKINKHYDDRIPEILLGDPVRINQILLNLLSNSLKFTSYGGQITINVNILEQDESEANTVSGDHDKVNIEFIVSDTGIGIPTEKLDVIFDPYVQSSSDTTRKYGGTGLGLSIVKRLVNMMNGTISVKSQLAVGTTFTFVLPLQKTTATFISKKAEIKINDNKLKQLGKLKVLLVEDIQLNQLLAKIILNGFGFETDVADNGKIAIELAEKNNYDIILMDLMMPEMDGYDATQYIRTKMEPPKSNTPIIALTADVTQRDVDRCSEVGMNDYISKPYNENDLLNKIVRLVNKFKIDKTL